MSFLLSTEICWVEIFPLAITVLIPNKSIIFYGIFPNSKSELSIDICYWQIKMFFLLLIDNEFCFDQKTNTSNIDEIALCTQWIISNIFSRPLYANCFIISSRVFNSFEYPVLRVNLASFIHLIFLFNTYLISSLKLCLNKQFQKQLPIISGQMARCWSKNKNKWKRETQTW